MSFIVTCCIDHEPGAMVPSKRKIGDGTLRLYECPVAGCQGQMFVAWSVIHQCEQMAAAYREADRREQDDR